MQVYRCLALPKASVERAEYRDEDSSPVAVMVGFAKALVTRKRSKAELGRKVGLQD